MSQTLASRSDRQMNVVSLTAKQVKMISSLHCTLSKVWLQFLLCFMSGITKCKHFAVINMKQVQSFETTTIMDAKWSKFYALFFLLSLVETNLQLYKSMKLLENEFKRL